jgi:hypothetical protein
VDLTAPDAERFPLFERAPPALVAHLAAGDVIFFPPRWWVSALAALAVVCRRSTLQVLPCRPPTSAYEG